VIFYINTQFGEITVVCIEIDTYIFFKMAMKEGAKRWGAAKEK
jgi:hypothetical protein